MSFVHLHVHSTYSDGAAHPTQLVDRAVSLGYSALALTDHGTLAGHPALVTACRVRAVQPLLGAEVRAWFNDEPGHVLVISRDADEYARLRATLRKRTPRLTDLRGTGLITTSCLGGHVAHDLRLGDYHTARDTLCSYRDLFGPDLSVEVQPTFGPILPWLFSLARELQLPTVATNDVHYLDHGSLRLASTEEMATACHHTGFTAALRHSLTLAETCQPIDP